MNGTLFLFRHRGVDDVLAVDAAHNHAARRACPGNIGNGKRDGRADHGDRLGRDIGINGKCGGYHHYVVENTLREKRTDRAIDQAAYENCFIGSSAFALFETAGNFAHGEHFFFVIHGKGEEIHSFARLFRHTHRHVHHGIAAAHKTRPVCLFGVLADFHGKFSARVIGCKGFAVF